MAPPTPTSPPTGNDHRTAAETALSSLIANSTTTNTAPTQPHPHTLTRWPNTIPLTSHIPSTSTLESFENAWHLGNYVLDRATGLKSFEPMPLYVRLGMHLLYYGYPQTTILHWPRVQQQLKFQTEKLGAWYDSPDSKPHIRAFIEEFHLQDTLQDLLEPDPSKYPTFNAFFARGIKPSSRPIAAPHDSLRTISSPADSRLTVFPTTSLATKYWIKSSPFTLSSLLRSQDLAAHFAGGPIAIARLAPQDYHRWHSPVDGTVESITEIPGTYYTVNPQAVTQPGGGLNVFCENRRSVMVVKRASSSGAGESSSASASASSHDGEATSNSPSASPSPSRVVIVAIGAMLVGSIAYLPEITVGCTIKRGQCLGSFHYGGSTVILLFQPGEVSMDEDLVRNSVAEQQQPCETVVRVGERVGRFVCEG